MKWDFSMCMSQGGEMKSKDNGEDHDGSFLQYTTNAMETTGRMLPLSLHRIGAANRRETTWSVKCETAPTPSSHSLSPCIPHDRDHIQRQRQQRRIIRRQHVRIDHWKRILRVGGLSPPILDNGSLEDRLVHERDPLVRSAISVATLHSKE